MMPSGNAIYTYTGPGESTEVQGQIFLKDQPKHITDQGVIAVCAASAEFELYEPRGAVIPTRFIPALAAQVVHEYDEARPAKPKKAKSK